MHKIRYAHSVCARFLLHGNCSNMLIILISPTPRRDKESGRDLNERRNIIFLQYIYLQDCRTWVSLCCIKLKSFQLQFAMTLIGWTHKHFVLCQTYWNVAICTQAKCANNLRFRGCSRRYRIVNNSELRTGCCCRVATIGIPLVYNPSNRVRWRRCCRLSFKNFFW